jgi:hypothetical protein
MLLACRGAPSALIKWASSALQAAPTGSAPPCGGCRAQSCSQSRGPWGRPRPPVAAAPCPLCGSSRGRVRDNPVRRLQGARGPPAAIHMARHNSSRQLQGAPEVGDKGVGEGPGRRLQHKGRRTGQQAVSAPTLNQLGREFAKCQGIEVAQAQAHPQHTQAHHHGLLHQPRRLLVALIRRQHLGRQAQLLNLQEWQRVWWMLQQGT